MAVWSVPTRPSGRGHELPRFRIRVVWVYLDESSPPPDMAAGTFGRICTQSAGSRERRLLGRAVPGQPAAVRRGERIAEGPRCDAEPVADLVDQVGCAPVTHRRGDPGDGLQVLDEQLARAVARTAL